MYQSDMSVCTSPDDQSMGEFNTDHKSPAEISASLALAVKGYGKDSQRVNDRNPIINQTKFLAGLSFPATEDATGRCLYHNLMQLIKKLGASFHLVVNNNFDCTVEQLRIRDVREKLTSAQLQDEAAAARVLHLPSDTVFHFRKDIQIANKKAELKEDFPQMSDQDIDLHVADYLLVLKSAYVEDHALYEEALELKNDAATRLRSYEKELSNLVTLETFLENLSLYQHSIATRLTTTLNDTSSTTSANLMSIQVKLKGKAVLHNAEVVDPLVNLHLPGLMWLLYTTYVVDSLNYYFDALIEAFSYTMAHDEALTSPDVALARLVGICNDWHMRGSSTACLKICCSPASL